MSAYERRTVNADGIETSYLEAGREDAPTLVLLHDGAFGSDAESCWGAFIPELADAFHVIAPDLIGHGGTRKIVAFDQDPMTLRIAHVRAFLSALGIDDPLIVGSSFGGGMILRGAASGGLPMRGGITLAGTGGLYANAEQFAILQAYQPNEEWSRAVCEVMAGDAVTDEMVADRLERSTAAGHYEALAAPRLVQPVVAKEPFDWRPGFLDALTRVTVPLLLVEGGADTLFERGWAERMAAGIPTARAVVIDGVRHLPHAQKPAEVARLIREFDAGHTA